MSGKTCFLQDPYSQLCTWVQSPGPHQLSKHRTTSIFWICNVPCLTTEALRFAQKLSLCIPQIHSSHPPVLGGLWPLTDFNSILKSTWRLTSGHSQDRSIIRPPTAKLTLTSLSMKSTTKHNPSPATWSKRNITETAEVGRENYYKTRKQVFSNLLQT